MCFVLTWTGRHWNSCSVDLIHPVCLSIAHGFQNDTVSLKYFLTAWYLSAAREGICERYRAALAGQHWNLISHQRADKGALYQAGLAKERLWASSCRCPWCYHNRSRKTRPCPWPWGPGGTPDCPAAEQRSLSPGPGFATGVQDTDVHNI